MNDELLQDTINRVKKVQKGCRARTLTEGGVELFLEEVERVEILFRELQHFPGLSREQFIDIVTATTVRSDGGGVCNSYKYRADTTSLICQFQVLGDDNGELRVGAIIGVARNNAPRRKGGQDQKYGEVFYYGNTERNILMRGIGIAIKSKGPITVYDEDFLPTIPSEHERAKQEAEEERKESEALVRQAVIRHQQETEEALY